MLYTSGWQPWSAVRAARGPVPWSPRPQPGYGPEATSSGCGSARPPARAVVWPLYEGGRKLPAQGPHGCDPWLTTRRLNQSQGQEDICTLRRCLDREGKWRPNSRRRTAAGSFLFSPQHPEGRCSAPRELPRLIHKALETACYVNTSEALYLKIHGTFWKMRYVIMVYFFLVWLLKKKGFHLLPSIIMTPAFQGEGEREMETQAAPLKLLSVHTLMVKAGTPTQKATMAVRFVCCIT